MHFIGDTLEMTPWNRVDRELTAKRKDWKWLAEKMDLKIQTINHWQARGIPAKHHAEIETTLGKPRGWIDGDVQAVTAPADISAAAYDLAKLLDMIPETDRISRVEAFNAASMAILQVLHSSKATGPSDPDSKRQ